MAEEINPRYKFSTPARASIWYTASSLAERAGSLLFTPIITRLLTPEEFGLYPLYLSWMGIFTALCTLEISGAVVYRALVRFRDADRLSSAAIGFISTATAVLFTIYAIFQDAINSVTGLSFSLSVFLILQVYISGIQGIYLSKCKHGYEYRKVSAVNLASAILTPLVCVLLIFLTPLRAEARIIAPLAVSSILTLPVLFKVLSRGKVFYSGEIWKYLIKLALLQLPHFLSATLSLQLSRIMVGRVFGEGELAKYSVALSIGFALSFATTSLISALGPWINRKLMQGDTENVNSVVGQLFFLFSALSLLLLSISPELLSFMAPKEYRGALSAIYPIALSIPFSFLHSAMHTVLVFYEKSFLSAACAIATGVTTLLANLTFTLPLGYSAAAFIILLSSVTSPLLIRLSLVAVSKKRILPLREILFPSFFFFAVSPITFLFRDVFIARLLLGAAILFSLIPRAREYRTLIKEK